MGERIHSKSVELVRLLQLLLYRILLLFIFAFSFVFQFFLNDKVKKILSQKKVFLHISKKFPQKPIWFHVASGEFEYIKHLIRLIKTQNPEQPVIVSYFSISYQKPIESFPGVDFSFMLPWDFSFSVRHLLKQIPAKSLTFVRTDLWPELIHQAVKKNIPVHFIAARKSRYLFNNLYLSAFSTIHCIHESDVNFFKSLNFHLPAKINLSGDPRFDQVFYRLSEQKQTPLLKDSKSSYFIGGSLWPEDEVVILDYIAKNPHKFKWILVPHENTPEHLRTLIQFCQRHHLDYSLFSKSQNLYSSVTIVDAFGILAQLYKVSDVAFIGGSFKKQVHSVMEALCCGCLTVVGPMHTNNSEALEFKKIKLTENMNAVNVIATTQELENLIIHFKKMDLFQIKKRIIELCENKKGASQKLLSFFLTPP